MNPILRHFPWATPEEQVLLRAEFMRRAALGFEEAEMWRDAAECWSSLGEHARAGELHARISDLGNAALSQVRAGRYADALGLYLQWESGLAKGDILNQIRALLGQARCHLSGADPKKKTGALSRKAGLEAYARARELLEDEEGRDPRTASRCWAALADYGAGMRRYDLLEEGYERALAHDDSEEILSAYLAAARERDDRVLIRNLEERLAEFGETGEELPRLKPGDPWTDPVTGMEFVYVPGGSFMMGDIFGDGNNYEKPVHEVELSPYYMGKYPVTLGQWKQFLSDTGYEGNEENGWRCKGMADPEDFSQEDDHPVACVSWHEAVAFAEWLSGKTGHGFRLPTEAEWEYAARSGGKEHRYSGTSEEDELGQYAWYSGNSDRKTHPVGEKKANDLGIHDMSGNVWEWCLDVFGDYSEEKQTNPIYIDRVLDIYETDHAHIYESGSRRVVRGGGWFGGTRTCRSAYRNSHSPGNRDYALGFRLLRTP